jgi:cytochrome c553
MRAPMQDIAKGAGLIVVGLFLVAAVASGAIYVVSDNKLNEKVDVAVESIAVPSDITSIQRGQHLASAVALCSECHGGNLAGRIILDDPAIGRVVAPNLTRGRGGVGNAFANADFVRAIRYGIDPSGRQLLTMPSDDYNHFGDADLGAIIAYVRSMPPIDTALPRTELRTVGRILFATGQLPLQPAANIDRSAVRLPTPPANVSSEYGAYLTLSAGCPSCHGPGLSGGPVPQTPPGTVLAANLTPLGLGTWSDADFLKVMRTGARPDGRRIDTIMPWPYYAQMSDDELRAIWRFLQSVPPRTTGSR